jgi:hypothetical protein
MTGEEKIKTKWHLLDARFWMLDTGCWMMNMPGWPIQSNYHQAAPASFKKQ